MNNLGDYLQKRATELGLERADQLAEIQAYLDKLYPGQCRATGLNDGVLNVTVSSASLASELRMQNLSAKLEHFSVSRVTLRIG